MSLSNIYGVQGQSLSNRPTPNTHPKCSPPLTSQSLKFGSNDFSEFTGKLVEQTQKRELDWIPRDVPSWLRQLYSNAKCFRTKQQVDITGVLEDFTKAIGEKIYIIFAYDERLPILSNLSLISSETTHNPVVIHISENTSTALLKAIRALYN